MSQELVDVALAEARRSRAEGGIPIGAAIADRDGRLLATGHNRMLLRHGDCTSHAELNAIRHLTPAALEGATIATTMPPCWMCGGAIRQFRLARLVVVRQPYDSGAAAWLGAQGVVVERVENSAAVGLFEVWRDENPELWPNPRLEDW